MSDELCLISADRSRRLLVHAVALLDAWLETMRGPDGYGGPVVHWWQDNLLYTGVGLDWRYEGIILGYLNLYRATGEERWLDKARRAGDDLVRGQLPAAEVAQQIGEQVGKIMNQNPSVPVYLEADGANNYSVVMELMGTLQAAGVPNVLLVTQPPGAEAQ